MQALPRNARLFVGFICVLGLLAALAALRLPAPAEAGRLWELGLFLALSVLAGGTKVRLTPRGSAEDIGSLSLSFALIFATLLRFGPGAAMLAGGLSTLSSCLYPRRQAAHQVLVQPGADLALDVRGGPGLPVGQRRDVRGGPGAAVRGRHGLVPVLSS